MPEEHFVGHLRVQIPQRGDNMREGSSPVKRVMRRFDELRKSPSYESIPIELRVQLEMACYKAKDPEDFEARAEKILGHKI